MKKCTKCRREMDESSFYMNRGRLMAHCKDCHKAMTITRSYERYHNDPDFRQSVLDSSKSHAASHVEAKRRSGSKAQTAHRKKFPEKAYCRDMTKRVLVFSTQDKHHWSYERCHAKDIIPIKKSDHVVLHNNLEYDQDMYKYRIKETGYLLDTKDKHVAFIKQLGLDFDESYQLISQ
jgi:hypothetical protein